MVVQKWVHLALMGTMALATLFAFFALTATWAYDGDPEVFARGYEVGGVSQVSAEGKTTADLGSKGFDDADGVGLARTGGVMMIIGACFFAVAFIAFENQWLTGKQWIGLVALGATGIGFLLWVIGLILFPLGVNGLAESFGGFAKPDLKWGAGLAFGILAGVFSLAAGATAGIMKAVSSGFKLELADSHTTASFD